jgi:prevent-host-death family protein
MTDVSVRALRSQTAALLRRVESGERVRITVGGRGVAELTPLVPRVWVSGRAMVDDLAAVRDQTEEAP